GKPTGTIVGGPGAENSIAFNGLQGINMDVGGQDLFDANFIFGNGKLGIQLGSDDGVSPNDVSDLDGGPNSLQNFPVVSAAISSGTDTTIYATLNSSPNTSFGIRFYSSGACDASGF